MLAKQDVAIAHYDVGVAALRQNDRAAADEHFAACLALREKLHAVSKSKVSEMDLMVALAARQT